MSDVRRKKKRRRPRDESSSTSLGFSADLANVEQLEHGHGIVIFGPPGCGKSSIAAYAPDVLFLVPQLETGVLDLVKAGLIPKVAVSNVITSWPDTHAWLDRIINTDHNYKWVVLDTLSRFETLLHQYVCEEEFKGDMTNEGYYSYNKGPKVAGNRYFPHFLAKLDIIRSQGTNILILCHSNIKTEPNPNGISFDQLLPDLEKTIWQTLYGWAEAVMYYEQIILTEKTQGKNKGKDSGIRGLYTTRSDSVLAKNRLNLDSFVELDDSPETSWNILESAINKG